MQRNISNQGSDREGQSTKIQNRPVSAAMESNQVSENFDPYQEVLTRKRAAGFRNIVGRFFHLTHDELMVTKAALISNVLNFDPYQEALTKMRAAGFRNTVGRFFHLTQEELTATKAAITSEILGSQASSASNLRRLLDSPLSLISDTIEETLSTLPGLESTPDANLPRLSLSATDTSGFLDEDIQYLISTLRQTIIKHQEEITTLRASARVSETFRAHFQWLYERERAKLEEYLAQEQSDTSSDTSSYQGGSMDLACSSSDKPVAFPKERRALLDKTTSEEIAGYLKRHSNANRENASRPNHRHCSVYTTGRGDGRDDRQTYLSTMSGDNHYSHTLIDDEVLFALSKLPSRRLEQGSNMEAITNGGTNSDGITRYGSLASPFNGQPELIRTDHISTRETSSLEGELRLEHTGVTKDVTPQNSMVSLRKTFPSSDTNITPSQVSSHDETDDLYYASPTNDSPITATKEAFEFGSFSHVQQIRFRLGAKSVANRREEKVKNIARAFQGMSRRDF